MVLLLPYHNREDKLVQAIILIAANNTAQLYHTRNGLNRLEKALCSCNKSENVLSATRLFRTRDFCTLMYYKFRVQELCTPFTEYFFFILI